MTTQLETLRQFPLTMQWRAEWAITTQYVKNDVVISSIDRAIYVLLITSELGGTDPSVNSNWFPITSPTSGVTDLFAEDGVDNIGSGTNPILANTGIITVRPGSNISITGTASNPIVNGVPSIQLCNLFDSPTAVITDFPVDNTRAGQITYGTSLSPLFNEYMTNGAPDPDGGFFIDLTSLNFKGTGNPPAAFANAFRCLAVDTALNQVAVIAAQRIFISIALPIPMSITFGSVFVKIANLRNAGLRAVNALRFSITPTNPMSFYLTALGNITAVYAVLK